jgi:hypothetical protein
MASDGSRLAPRRCSALALRFVGVTSAVFIGESRDDSIVAYGFTRVYFVSTAFDSWPLGRMLYAVIVR